MRIVSIIFFLLISELAHSQQMFSGFSERKAVKWAALWRDTVRFSNLNLSLLLRQRFSKNEITAGTLSWDEVFRMDKSVPRNTIVNYIEPSREQQLMNADGEVIGTVQAVDDVLLSHKYFDDELKELVEAAQIIYVKKGRLYSYVPWVSPKMAVVTSWQQKLGMANAFTTAFNTCKKFSAGRQKQSIFLGSAASTLFPDSTGSVKMIKQLYEHELLQELWPQIAKGKFKIIAIDSAKAIPFSLLTQSLLSPQRANASASDDDHSVTTFIPAVAVPLIPSDFTKVVLENEWYYHARLNRVFTKPIALLLFARKWSSSAQNEYASPVVKIRLQ